MTALHIAAAHPYTESCAERMVKALLKAGADANKADSGGLKAVHAAAATKRRAVVEALLPVTAPDEDGGEWTVDGVMTRASRRNCADAARRRRLGRRQGQRRRIAPSPSWTPMPRARRDAPETKRLSPETTKRQKRNTASLEKDGSCAKTWANRAAARLKLKKYADARDDARASRTLDPRFLKAWYREGEAALELEQYEDSALAFFEGLQIDGDNADCKRMFDEAIARGRAAAARTPLLMDTHIIKVQKVGKMFDFDFDS